MNFVLYFIIFVIIVIFLFLQIFNIYNEKVEQGYEKYLNLLIYLVFLSTIIAIIINIVSFYKTHKKTGIPGPMGLRGRQGKQGSKGQCNVNCGRNICYISTTNYANSIFREKVGDPTKKIKNRDFLKKINKICKSDQYMDVLVQKHKKKPTEHRLINYIKDIISEWMEIILHDVSKVDNKTKHGYIFLSQPNLKFKWLFTKDLETVKPESTVISTNTAGVGKYKIKVKSYSEIKHYDIWQWGEEQPTKKLTFEITMNDNLDKQILPDKAQLYVMKSNNYTKVYDAYTNDDVWDIKNCPFNQMGPKRDNPNNLTKCIYTDPKKMKKQYENTWKEKEFNKPDEVSLYNSNTFKNDNNQLFYPVGSVWRGKNTDERLNNYEKYPHSLSKCGDGHGTQRNEKYNDKGPEKDTVLVSGDVVPPKSYKKIWDSKKKCADCQVSATQIFRPIAPKGYQCLGDVVIPWTDDTTDIQKENQRKILDSLNIRCVPKKCVREKSLGPKIWHNKNLNVKEYKDYISYTSNRPQFKNNQLPVSIWSAGNRNSGEEINNRYGIQLEENGGYNLFRTSPEYDIKPKDKTYVIKEECLLPARGKMPKPLEFNMSKLKDKHGNNNKLEKKYTTEYYFKTKPQQAILTNFDSDFDTKLTGNYNNSVYSPEFNNNSKINKGGKRKRFYLVNDGTKNCDEKFPDTYFIKTYNEEKNDFSSCLKYDDVDEKIVISPVCDKRKKEYRWYLDYSGKDSEDASNKKVRVKSYSNHKCLKNYYDINGDNINILVDCGERLKPATAETETEEELKGSNIWLYQTLIDQKLPNKGK